MRREVVVPEKKRSSFRVACASCNRDHDLSDVEPSFDRPDAYFEVPESERASRTVNTAGLCAILGRGADANRYFVRVVLPVRVRGEARRFCWGTWAEVAEAEFIYMGDHWEHPDQAKHPPFAGRLANEIPFMPSGVPPVRGLEGTVRPVGPGEYPELILNPDLDHPFALEQRDGIHVERLLEYLSPALHER
jgi:hypothetical protein